MPEETQNPPQPDEATAAPEAAAAEAGALAAEEKLPENLVTIEDAGTLRKKVTVEVPRERIDAKFEEMFGELKRTAQVPGFRVGRAPRRLIEKRFGKEVAEDVRNSLLGEAMGSAVEGRELKVVGEPDIKLEEIKLPEEGSLTFSFEVEVAPDFELPEYKGIEVRRPVIEVTDQRVEQALEEWRRSQGRLKPVTGKIKPADAITAKVALRGEGIEHDEGEVELRVAPAQIVGVPVEDLPKALVGHMAGESCAISTTVPAGHPQEAWRGKQVTVTLEVQEVKRLELPPLDAELARLAGYESLQQLREVMRSGLTARLAEQQRRAMHDQVHKYFLAKTQLEVPAGAAGRHAERLLARRYLGLLLQGVARQEIDQHMQELEVAAASQAAEDLKLSFILGRLAEQEGVEVDEGEVNARIAQMARRQRRRPERLRQEFSSEGTLEDLVTALREEKAVEKVLESAKIVEEQLPAKQEAGDSESKP